MNYKHFIALCTLAFAMISCQEQIRTDLEQKILVESFIRFGSDSNTLEIRLFTPLSQSNESPFKTPQSTQIINVSKNVELFPEFISEGIFKISSEQLKLGEEDILELRINYEGQTIYSRTKVPSRTSDMRLSDDELKINYVVDAVPIRINLVWTSNIEENYYLIQIDTASRDPLMIDPDRIGTDPNSPYLDIAKIGVPISSNQVEISYPAVKYFGRHRLILYHISQEYYDLYNNPVQGSYNKLNQSVINGLGIFTAMNSDTIYFKVIL